MSGDGTGRVIWLIVVFVVSPGVIVGLVALVDNLSTGTSTLANFDRCEAIVELGSAWDDGRDLGSDIIDWALSTPLNERHDSEHAQTVESFRVSAERIANRFADLHRHLRQSTATDEQNLAVLADAWGAEARRIANDLPMADNWYLDATEWSDIRGTEKYSWDLYTEYARSCDVWEIAVRDRRIRFAMDN